MYRAEVRLKIILNRVNEEKVEKLEDCQFNYSFIQTFKFVSSFNVLHVNILSKMNFPFLLKCLPTLGLLLDALSHTQKSIIPICA